MYKFLGVAIIALFGLGQEAMATYFRGMSISWQQATDGNVNSVTFHVTGSWRWSAFGNPFVGVSINTGSLAFGDGSSQNDTTTVVAINPSEDWFIGSSTFTHTYPNIGIYGARVSDCCRISGLQDGNSGNSFIVATDVALSALGGARSPDIVAPGLLPLAPGLTTPTTVPNNPFLVHVQLNTINTYNLGVALPALDPNWVYSLAPPSDSGLTTAAPAGLTLSSTGMFTWVPTVAGLYAVQVKLSNTVTGAEWAYDTLFKVIPGPVADFYTTLAPPPPQEPAPAPGAISLVGLGLIGLTGLSRRCRAGSLSSRG